MSTDDTCRCAEPVWVFRPSAKVFCLKCGGSQPVPRVVQERP